MSTQTLERPSRRGPGRPKLPRNKARSIFEKLRVNKEEQKEIRAAAEKAGVDRSEWMRETLLEAAKAA